MRAPAILQRALTPCLNKIESIEHSLGTGVSGTQALMQRLGRMALILVQILPPIACDWDFWSVTFLPADNVLNRNGLFISASDWLASLAYAAMQNLPGSSDSCCLYRNRAGRQLPVALIYRAVRMAAMLSILAL
jgi:hypothetical protein